VIRILLPLALFWSQNADTITRLDQNRGFYQEAVDACKDAEKLLASSPESALEKLTVVFDGIAAGRFNLVERRIFIEAKAQEPLPHDFFPYHLRGRAKLLSARKHKDEEARRLLIDAATDLQASVGRKADRSKEPLAEALKDLWDNVRAALTYEGWTAERSALSEPALALLGASEFDKKAGDWIVGEAGKVEGLLVELRKKVADLDARRRVAGQAASWCEKILAAVKPSASFQAAQTAAARALALAVAIRDSRGLFRLKIAVSPYAKVEKLERPGEVVDLADRDTPLVIPRDLEIDTYTVELVHPKGRKKAFIPANSLQPGRTYVLWGDMNGDEFKVELLK
jgi:hypothetical protein